MLRDEIPSVLTEEEIFQILSRIIIDMQSYDSCPGGQLKISDFLKISFLTFISHLKSKLFLKLKRFQHFRQILEG
jgi:hypothetical protein